jgi:hypothetical protein
MKRLHPILFAPLCASLALLCACGDIVDISSEESYSQKCSSSADFDGFQKDFGGYKEGKSIPYKHSDGYLFSLTVTSRTKEFDSACQKHMNTVLESPYPIYYSSVSATAPTFYYSELDQLRNDAVVVKVGQYTFALQNPKGLDSTKVSTMEINGVKYTDVAVSNGRKYKQPYTNINQYSTEESDAKLYYQTKKGILKIELEDGSSIAINEGDK